METYETHEHTNGSVGTPVMCFLLGAAVGATVALLTAPATGSEMRYKLKEKASQVKDKAYELKDLAAEKAEAWKEKAVGTTAETLDRASETVRRAGSTSQATQERKEMNI